MSKRMKIMHGNRSELFGLSSVAFEFLSEEKALNYHKQSLDRLNERGGMGVKEILYNVNAIDLPELNSGFGNEDYCRLLRYAYAFWSRGVTIDDLHKELDKAKYPLKDRILAALRDLHAEHLYHYKPYNATQSKLFNEVLSIINDGLAIFLPPKEGSDSHKTGSGEEGGK
jgi:hypothetical protein